MDPIKLQIKITKLLDSLAGSTLTKQEILGKIAPSFSTKTDKKEKSKKNRFKPKDNNMEWVLTSLLKSLESEGLVHLEHKKVRIANPFRLYGRISVSRKGDGFVSLPSKSEVFIPFHHVNSAISGDKVEVKPVCLGRKDRFEGNVTTIVKRGRTLYRVKITEDTGKLLIGNMLDMLGDGKEGYVVKKTLLKDTLDRIRIGDVIIAKLKDDSVPENHLYEMTFVQLESEINEDPDLNRVLMKYDLSIQHPDDIPVDFPETIDQKTVKDWDKRVDLRELYSVTIDGETAKDFDDAISFEKQNGKIRFWVHIADVSHYVVTDSPLDKEAYRRGTSVYLSNRVVPMLPPILSENLCSLIANTPRLAFTVEMEASLTGEIFSAKFYKSIIQVNQRYTYEMAETEINEANPENWIFQISQFTTALRKARMKSGRVDLNLKEVAISLDKKNQPTGIITKPRLQSHILIEELMLSANLKVDEYLRKKKIPNLHRIHEAMDEEKLETLNQFLQMYGVNTTIADTSYPEIMNAVQSINDEKIERLFSYILLRSFMQAYYGEESKGHWGLGFKDYCHFTSPIRRYPDLIVHRILESYLFQEEGCYSLEELKFIGTHCSEEERRAADAERDIQKLRSFRYLESTGRNKFDGFIVGIRPGQIYIELQESNLEGILEKTEFTNEFELLIRNDFSFYSQKYTKDFFIGDKVEVEIQRIDYEEIKLYLTLKGFESKGKK